MPCVIGTHPAEQVSLPSSGADTLISRLMSRAIIDLLEVIDVKHGKNKISGPPTLQNVLHLPEKTLVFEKIRAEIENLHIAKLKQHQLSERIIEKQGGQRLHDEKGEPISMPASRIFFGSL